MLNFTFYNPTKVIFGKGTIPEVKKPYPRTSQGSCWLSEQIEANRF